MICIRCGHDSKYRERTGRRCPKCNGEFAFEPKTGDSVTDKMFQAAIDAVSANGQVRWGVEHLYYEVCRRHRRQKKVPWFFFPIIALFFGVLTIIAWVNDGPVWVPLLFLALVSAVWVLVWKNARSPTVPISLDQFNALWARWQPAHGTPKGSIIRQPQKPRAKREAEPDLGDYSFDRAVICDRARTVDLLLANNFHFENNCAVLSLGGYPEGPFETVRTMLRRNPRLQVFALHDASASGCRLAYRLATDSAWFKGQARVIDVGLRPRHVEPFRGLWLAAGLRVLPGEGLVQEEAEWLSRHTLELAAIRPEQVLKRLFRALNRKPETERAVTSGDGGGGDGTSVSFTSSGGQDSPVSAGIGTVAPGDPTPPVDPAPGLDFESAGAQDGGDAVGYDFDSFSSEAGDSDGGADSFG